MIERVAEPPENIMYSHTLHLSEVAVKLTRIGSHYLRNHRYWYPYTAFNDPDLLIRDPYCSNCEDGVGGWRKLLEQDTDIIARYTRKTSQSLVTFWNLKRDLETALLQNDSSEPLYLDTNEIQNNTPVIYKGFYMLFPHIGFTTHFANGLAIDPFDESKLIVVSPPIKEIYYYTFNNTDNIPRIALYLQRASKFDISSGFTGLAIPIRYSTLEKDALLGKSTNSPNTSCTPHRFLTYS